MKTLNHKLGAFKVYLVSMVHFNLSRSKRRIDSCPFWFGFGRPSFPPKRMAKLSTVIRSSSFVFSRSSRSTTTPRVLDRFEQKKRRRGRRPTRPWTKRLVCRSLIRRIGERMKSEEAHMPLQTHCAPTNPTPTTWNNKSLNFKTFKNKVAERVKVDRENFLLKF